MNMNKFTEKAQQAIITAQEAAETNNQSEIGVEHLLLALAGLDEGMALTILQNLGVNLDQLRQRVRAEIQALPKVYGQAPLEVFISSKLNKILTVALQEARRLNEEYAGTEHLLLAVAGDHEDPAAARILRGA